jgi:hypothetical protein
MIVYKVTVGLNCFDFCAKNEIIHSSKALLLCRKLQNFEGLQRPGSVRSEIDLLWPGSTRSAHSAKGIAHKPPKSAVERPGKAWSAQQVW